MNNNAYMTFNEAAINICSYLGDEDGTVLFSKVSRQLMHTIDMLQLYLFPSVGVARITVQENLTAPLPDDFVSLTRIGICCEGRNEIIPIDYNGDLCPIPTEPFTLDCCDCTKVVDEQGAIDEDNSECCHACGIGTDSHKHTGYIGAGRGHYGYYYYSYLFGVKSNYKEKGTYKVEKQNGRIVFGSGCYVAPGKELILEYSSAAGAKEYMRIPRETIFLLQHHVAYLIKKPLQEREYEHKKFRMHYRKVKSSLMRYTLEDFTNAFRSGYHSSIKG